MSNFATIYKNQLNLYLQLGKFRLCTLVLFTTLVGYGLGNILFIARHIIDRHGR
jgi:heme O synthase-like polyprenyltransferase